MSDLVPPTSPEQTTEPSSILERQTNFAIGAGLAAQGAGSKSLLDTATDIVSKGIPLTGAAILNSFYNTAVQLGNFAGGDFQESKLEDVFGPDSDTTAYYKEHAGPVEGLALAIGSLAPGLGAIKLLKVAQLGRFGETVQMTTGLFSGIQKTAIASADAEMLANGTGQSLFGLSRGNTIKGILAGAADQALQGAVYETATLATMHASPLTNSNTLFDDISDIKDSALAFGAIGGVLEGAGTYYKIKKGIQLSDIGSKFQEKFGAQGLGNLTPGDRIVKLYEAMDALPTPTTRLEEAKNLITRGTTSRMIQDELIKVANRNVELAGAFRDFLEEGRKSGAIDSETLINNLGQLSKLGRHGDVSVVTKAEDAFYIPNKLDARQGTVEHSTHDDLWIPHSAFDTTPSVKLSKAYVLKNPNQLPEIGRATDVITLPGLKPGEPDTKIAKFAGAMDAHKKGIDIYVDANGGVHINENSSVFKEVPKPGMSRGLTVAEEEIYSRTGNLPPGSKPLNSVGQVLNLKTGAITDETILPVVGDFAPPKLEGRGLRVKNKLFPQSIGRDFSPSDMSPLEANARYVWADMRSIKKGDSFAPNDLPMLEKLYKEKVAGVDHGKFDLSFTDGRKLDYMKAEDLLQHIADTKHSMYADLLADGKNADEISHYLNAPEKGMTKNFNTLDPNELIRPAKDSAKIQHVRLAYDIGTTKNSEGNLLRGMQATNYRMKLAADINANQVASYLGKMAPDPARAESYYKALKLTKTAQDADLGGAGNSFLANANANYNTLSQQVERVGRVRSELMEARKATVEGTLSADVNRLRQKPELAAEYGNWDAVVKSTGEHYSLLTDEEAYLNRLPKNTIVLEGALAKADERGIREFNANYLPPGFQSGVFTNGKALKNYYTFSDDLISLEKSSMALNEQRNSLRADWNSAQGVSKGEYPSMRIYHPPLDGNKFQFMAYVRHREGYAMGESGAHVIVARSAEDLQVKISQLGPEYDAFTKADIASFKKAEGEYQFNRNFMNNKVQEEMARKGILNNVVPESRAQNIINDLVDWHMRQEGLLLNDHIEMHNAATFDQLRAMGDRWDQTGTSRFGAITPFMKRSADNPYNSYIRTALGVSARDSYPMWGLAAEKLDSLADRAFNAVKDAFGASQKGLLSIEDAAKVSKKMGLGNPYGDVLTSLAKDKYYGGLANALPEQKIFSKFVATANTVLGATIIRLDTFQQLIHAVTMPIMTAMEYAASAPELQKLLSVTVPGTTQQVPGFSRVLYSAVRNYFGADSETLQKLYSTATGLTRDELAVHRQMINELSMPNGSLSKEGWAQKIDKATQAAEKLTGTKFTNQFIHFVSSDVGRQLGEAMGHTGQDLLDTIGTFTGRVLGNQAAGQRAGIFQGPIGQAVGLFQSYQMNLMQQLLRHIGDGNYKALAIGAGMQSSIFGLSSLPGFHFLNQIIADRHNNPEGSDLYSGAANLLGKENSEYLLYGGLSGLLGTSLYSRGDLNPRRATILPVNPLNFPSVSAGIRIYQNLMELENNLTTKGGSVPASLLLAAEHNGLSRPLTGLAEMFQGYSTTAKGDMISRVAGLSEMSSIADMSRILGAKPLDESVAMDALYRSNALKTRDHVRLEELGQAVKTSLYAGHELAPDIAVNVMADYVKAGGTQTNFNSWFLSQLKGANVPTANRVMENFHNPRAVYLQTLMGGVPLPSATPQAATPPPLPMQTPSTSVATPNPSQPPGSTLPLGMR